MAAGRDGKQQQMAWWKAVENRCAVSDNPHFKKLNLLSLNLLSLEELVKILIWVVLKKRVE